MERELMLPIDQNAPVPRPGRSIWYTEEGIRRARENIRTQAWAAKEWERISTVAERWVRVSDEEILALVPAQGSIFCSGRNGSPCCKAAWRCDVAQPRRAFCADCGREYPENRKGSPFGDEGHGFYYEGKWFAPVPVWNSYVVSMLSTYSYGSGGPTDNALLNLALAYAITGETRFGERALLIYDALATLAPTTIGPLDIPEGQEREMGRMHAETCHVNRQRFVDMQAYDLISGLDGMDEPSPTRGDRRVRIRENIAEGMLEDYVMTEGGGYNLREGNLTHFQNHELDGFRALLSIGLATDQPDFIRWAGSAFRAFLENVIGRDGGYYENSEMYAYFSGTLMQDVAELLYHYDPGKYASPDDYPPAEALVGLKNAFDHPRLVRLCLEYTELIRACGRIPSYGNTNALPGYRPPSKRQVMPSHWSLLERLYFRSENADTRQRAKELMLDLSDGAAENVRNGTWALFNSKPGPAGEARSTPSSASSFVGHKGVVVLRSGTGDRSRALIVRGGANLLSQDDQLAAFLYDRGRMVIEDVGYALAGSHVHKGWGMRAISHAMVTVDEDIPTSQGYEFVPSADLVAFEDLGGVKIAEYSAPLSRIHQGATEYRRALIFCDVDEATSYTLDLFLVAGGRIHDYAMNGPRFFEGDSGSYSLEGVSPEARAGVWTLAALGTMDGSEEANAPGKSWGERIGPNDRIQGVAAPDGSPLPYGWLPPPGNGYAFVHDVKTAVLEHDAYAHWRFGDVRDTHYGVWFPADHSATLIAAKGPDLKGAQQIHRLIVRREGEDLKSLFVSVFEAFSGSLNVVGARVLARDADTGSAAVRVELADGRRDTHLFSRDGSIEVRDPDGVPIALSGRFGVVRERDGEVALYLVEGTRLRFGDAETTLPQTHFEARITATDADAETVSIDRGLPEGMPLEGRLCRVEADAGDTAYSHGSGYRVTAAVDGRNARLVLQHGDPRLARGTVVSVEAPDILVCDVPLAFAWGFNNSGDKGEYRGKVLRTEDGSFMSRIVELLAFKKLRLESVAGLRAGSRFEILDFKPGDRISIPNSGSRCLARRT
jgi:hypothetical protein